MTFSNIVVSDTVECGCYWCRVWLTIESPFKSGVNWSELVCGV